MTQSSSSSSQDTVATFLQEYPDLSTCLFEECDRDLSKIQTVLEPLCTVSDRCQNTPYYIQAISTGRTTFLSTNLSRGQRGLWISSVASNWTVGRSRNCTIAIPKSTVSRCHAAIGHIQGKHFYLMDMESSNGTRVNRRRIPAFQRRTILDGDLVEFGSLKVEFFIARSPDFAIAPDEPRREELTLH